MVALGGVAVSYERGTPVTVLAHFRKAPCLLRTVLGCMSPILLTHGGWRERRVGAPSGVVAGGWGPYMGYLAHKKTPTPLGPPQGPRYGYCRVLG